MAFSYRKGGEKGVLELFVILVGGCLGCDFNEEGSHEEMRLEWRCVVEWIGERFSV